MALNLAFGPVSLGASFEREFGPYVVKAQDDEVVLTVDRTVSNGLDANPDASIDITINQSSDGVNWIVLVTSRIIGGVQTFTTRDGVTHQYTQTILRTGLDLARARIKATVSNGDVPVAVAGTFVVN